MKCNIRKSNKEDCKTIAHLVTVSWNESYKNIVNDEFLNNMINTENLRYNSLYNTFNEEENHQYVLEVNDTIVGFLKMIHSKDEDYNNCAEIQALYILEGYKKNGFGKQLISKAKEETRNMGFNKILIGCLEQNSANNFYTSVGAKLVKTRKFELPNQNLVENVYLLNI